MTVNAADLIAMFCAIGAAIEAEKDRLSALDGAIGDGDHGVTMASGFKAANEALAGLDAAARAFLNAVGASAGPLYATAFMRAGAAVKGRDTLDREAMVAMVNAMVRGMGERGKAQRGDKTMMDAWLPAAEAMEAARAAGKDLAGCFADALVAAEAGAEATVPMVAAKGRAARLGERAVGHMDPGAASAAIVLGAMARTLGRG